MKKRYSLIASALCVLLAATPVWAAVSAEEAAQLKTSLTPLGAEKAGNKDGTIPAWDGGYTTPSSGFKNGGRRPDPFANEKPLFSINAKNMDQYTDKLTDGVKAMLKKYPETFRIDVYRTHRTAAAPQWVYDNTYKNATRAKINGNVAEGAYGGIPFPIPKNGTEVMWNNQLKWVGESWRTPINGILVTADGKQVLTVVGMVEQQMPYYFKDGSAEKLGAYWTWRLISQGPPIRAGENFVVRQNLAPDKDESWLYLTGQRRVRKLPNACCDTPNPGTAGVMGFDEIYVFNGRLDRFDWKIIGKKEIYIPYNSNRSLQPTKDTELLGAHHLNPDHVRWELHRVWVVEATLRQGQRHVAPKGRYYIDEDSWSAILSDRWDAKGELWKTGITLPVVMPDLPGVVPATFGFYDLLSGVQYFGALYNEKAEQYKLMPRYDDAIFTPDGLAGEGVR